MFSLQLLWKMLIIEMYNKLYFPKIDVKLYNLKLKFSKTITLYIYIHLTK